MDRIRMMRKQARLKGVTEPRYEDVLFSLLKDDEKKVDERICAFYSELGIKEPTLPKKPQEAYPVNKPVREQFAKDADYQAAQAAYPALKQAYETAEKQWEEYHQLFS